MHTGISLMDGLQKLGGKPLETFFTMWECKSLLFSQQFTFASLDSYSNEWHC